MVQRGHANVALQHPPAPPSLLHLLRPGGPYSDMGSPSNDISETHIATRISGFGFRVSGFGFRVQGFSFRVDNVTAPGVRVEGVRPSHFKTPACAGVEGLPVLGGCAGRCCKVIGGLRRHRAL